MKKLIALLFLSACVTHGELPDGLYSRLSKEDRAQIYERENEVTIAQSRKDEARWFKRQTEQRLGSLGEQWDRCKVRLEKSGKRASVPAAQKVLEGQKDFLKEQLVIAEAQLERRQLEINAAKSRLALQKQRQLVKSGLAGDESLAEYEAYVKQDEQAAQNAEKDELAKRAEAQKKFVKWKSSEGEYAKASGDYDSLVWVD